jgi:hypothetical protein
MKTPRLFIYTSDLMMINGKSEKTCRRLLQKMKEHFGVEKRQDLTYFQVCEFLGIPVDQFLPYISMFPFLIVPYNAIIAIYKSFNLL